MRALRLWWNQWIRGQVTVVPPFAICCPVCSLDIQAVMICRRCSRAHIAPCQHDLTFEAFGRLIERNAR
jgi:hypothetical protein